MSYNGRCVGRVIDFLSEYWNGSNAHNCIFNEKEIKHFDKVVATYTWKDNTDIPIFEFKSEWNPSEFLIERQKEDMSDLIDRFGYRELDPNDKFGGTTGEFLVEHKGRFLK